MTTTSTRLWVPRTVLVTRSAAELPHTAQIVARCTDLGVPDVEFLASDRLTGLRVRDEERATYARAKSTLGGRALRGRHRPRCRAAGRVGPPRPRGLPVGLTIARSCR